jgi:hypothetical protein
VLPSGPLPVVPLFQSPAEVYNLTYALKQLHQAAGFRHVKILHAGQHV